MRLGLLVSPVLVSITLGAAARAEAPRPPAKDKGFSVQAVAPAAAEVGKAARVEVKLLPGAGMHVNTEYPTAMTVAYPTGVEGPAGKVKPAKIDKSEARFDLAFTPREKGEKVITATVNFVVCNDAMTQCDPRREPVQIKVDVR
jgi:hypothetical protein